MSRELLNMKSLRASGAKPKFFGLGFIQLKLSDEQRLHFYHPSLCANVPDEELHNHRYDFESEVLAGSLTNELWSFTPSFGGPQMRVKVSCDPNVEVPSTEIPEQGVARLFLRFETGPGSKYRIAHDQFHRVKGENCITLLTRKSAVKTFADVIRGTGADHVCPFGVQMSEDDCWALIAEMIGEVMNPGYHVRSIPKGVLGEPSKILEEADEFRDALEQGVKLMGLIELSDMVGAIQAFLAAKHPGLSLNDLVRMNDVTRRAFENGHRH